VSQVAGSTALVTGGASGIGYLVGSRLLEGGLERLLVWDLDEEALVRAVDGWRSRGHRVDGQKVDVTDLEAVRTALQEIAERGVALDLLINNAGIVVGQAFASHTHDEIQRTMAVNALAPMHLARMVLPGMMDRGKGHIVNVSSAAAMVSNPGMSVYCGSKWALAGWSDSLRLEMERGGTGVRVTTVMPYYIDTGMFGGVRSRFIPILEPDAVAREIVSGVRKDRIFVRLPPWLALLPLLRGLLPTRWFDRIAGDWVGVYQSMDTFRGRVGPDGGATQEPEGSAQPGRP
jgi:all-trans-retinol dehydrogenase (NAD+)